MNLKNTKQKRIRVITINIIGKKNKPSAQAIKIQIFEEGYAEI